MEQKKKLIKVLQAESVVADAIPEQHKALVRDRIKKSKVADLLDWESVKNDFDGI